MRLCGKYKYRMSVSTDTIVELVQTIVYSEKFTINAARTQNILEFYQLSHLTEQLEYA